MEILDLYDINNNKLGKSIVRGEKPGKGEYIKLCVIYLKCKDRYLIQKCSVEKGGEFAVTGGHVPTGKTGEEQVIIEVKEELGITIDKGKLKLLGLFVKGNALFDVFMYEDDNLENQKFTLQKEEVEDVFWLTKEEISDLIDKGVVRDSTSKHFAKFIKNSDNM